MYLLWKSHQGNGSSSSQVASVQRPSDESSESIVPREVEVHRFGLTEVWCPEEEPLVDIVFVHGLNGNPKGTWTTNSSRVFWPADLLPIMGPERARALTYGYNSEVACFMDSTSRDGILQHAETLVDSLVAFRNLHGYPKRPIIFVCHSLGGLVVKRALIYSRNVSAKLGHLRSIYLSTYGIIFFGTPHNGSNAAKWGHVLQNIFSAVVPKGFLDTSSPLIESLKANSGILQGISSDFSDFISRFNILFLHETKPVKHTQLMVVEEDSAAPYIEGAQRAGIESDHLGMCKFENIGSPGYEVVAETLIRYSQNAPNKVLERWVEEAGDSTHSLPQEITSSGPNLHNVNLGLQKKPVIAPPGFHPNWVFVGMRTELQLLHERLSISRGRKRHPKSVLISGVAGSGKSHLAREYVWTHLNDYPGGIFWVDAKSYPSTCKCYWDIAQKVGLINGRAGPSFPGFRSNDECVEAVRNWFQAREGWLLVFDGFCFDRDENINVFKEFLPTNENCAIIYTSIDKTLARKQRLFEPYCITVAPLSERDGRKLLFKDLSIDRPTHGQKRRARELVQHYEGLPLAIHATSHRLRESFMPIEKYHIDSLTDKKLAEPFVGIMNDLYRTQHFEALNLINLLSYLGHHIPVNLITLGMSILETWGVQILTSNRPGERPDLDTTLGTLIKYGLIERIVDPRVFFDPKAKSGPGIKRAETVSLAESSSQEGSFSSNDSSSVTDVIKIHSVVQKFCRDELKLRDREYRRKGVPGITGFHDSWLVLVSRFFCSAYENARSKMDLSIDVGLAQDYREFSIHGCKILSLYPKHLTSKSPPIVYETLNNLEKVMRSIHDQAHATSPCSSQEDIHNRKSIFDRYSSPSASSPDSPEYPSSSSQQLTWVSDVLDPAMAEPWGDTNFLTSSEQFNLRPFQPHTLTENDTIAEGTANVASRPSSADSNTVIPTTTTEQKSKFLHRVGTSAPVVPVVTESSASGVLNPSNNSNQSEAQRVLATIQKSSPTQSESDGSTAYAGGPSAWDKIITGDAKYMNTAVARQVPSRESSPWYNPYGLSFASGLHDQSSHESLHSSEGLLYGGHPMAQSTSHGSRITRSDGDNELPLSDNMNTLQLHSAPASRCASRHSIAEVPIDTTSHTNTPMIAPPELPYDRNISIDTPHRGRSNTRTPALAPGLAPTPPAHPSAVLPGSSPSSTSELNLVCTSEPPPELWSQSEPMSRGPSGQSQPAWPTDPTYHHISSTSSHQHFIPQHHFSGMGSWINSGDLPTGSSPSTLNTNRPVGLAPGSINNQENEMPVPVGTGKSPAAGFSSKARFPFPQQPQ